MTSRGWLPSLVDRAASRSGLRVTDSASAAGSLSTETRGSGFSEVEPQGLGGGSPGFPADTTPAGGGLTSRGRPPLMTGPNASGSTRRFDMRPARVVAADIARQGRGERVVEVYAMFERVIECVCSRHRRPHAYLYAHDTPRGLSHALCKRVATTVHANVYASRYNTTQTLTSATDKTFCNGNAHAEIRNAKVS